MTKSHAPACTCKTCKPSLVDQYVAAVRHCNELSDQYHATITDGSHPPLPPHITEVIKVEVSFLQQVLAARDAYLATLPRIPRGYYLAACADPNTNCIGWHCYKHTDEPDPVGGYARPTSEFYCDGSSPITLDWLGGRLEDVPEEPTE